MNKRVVHKIISFILSPILCTALFIIPVSAESEIVYPDPDNYSGYQYFFNHGYNHLVLTDSNNITYNVNLSNNGTSSGSESGSEHTTGTINSNGSSTLGAKYMTCTTNTGTSASQTYSCYFSNRSSGVSNSQSINIGFNENTYTSVNNSISLNIDTDITGTITSSTNDKTYFYLPWLNGTYTHHNSFTYNDSMTVEKDKSQYIAFYCRTWNPESWKIYPEDSSTYKVTEDRISAGAGIWLYIYHIEYLDGPTGYYGNVTFDIDWLNNQSVIPIFAGSETMITENIREQLGWDTKTNSLLNSGNDETDDIVSNSDNSNTSLNNKINDFDSIENQQVNQMNTNLNNISINSDLMSNNGFLNSAQWVKVQFDRMTVNTPIGSVLSFSLILGLALIFLGKIR